MNTTEEHNFKASVLGSIAKVKANGNQKPDKIKIQEVIAEGAHIAVFCLGCGFTQGLSQKGAQDITKAFGIELPKPIGEKILTTTSCILCHEDFAGVELKDM